MIKNMIKSTLLLLFITFFVGCPSGMLSDLKYIEVVKGYTGDYLVGTKISTGDIGVKAYYANGYVNEYWKSNVENYNDEGFTIITNENFDRVGEHTVTVTFTYRYRDKSVTKSTNFTVNVVDHFAPKYTLTETPVFSSDGKTCTFGDYLYEIEGIVKIDPNTETFNSEFCEYFYVGNDGYYYSAKKNNGRIYIKHKLQPITWKVLENKNGEAFLVSDKVLDTVPYLKGNIGPRTIEGKTIYPNNYEHSTIRAFLNGLSYNDGSTTNTQYKNNGFLQKAFTSTAQSKILATDVDNSVASLFTGAVDNTKGAFTCNNTSDKVFLLSVKEFATYSTDKSNLYYALRSPIAASESEVNETTYKQYSVIKYEGESGFYDVSYDVGVLPAIWVTVE